MLTPTLHLTDWQIEEAARYAARRDERRPIDRRHARPREARRQPKQERKEQVKG